MFSYKLDKLGTDSQNWQGMIINENASETPRYRIGMVSRLTGLSADVIRVWERRYGVIRPARSEGGSRLYSEADISRLRQLRQAIEKGNNIGQAAKLPAEELEGLLGSPRHSAPAEDPYSTAGERFLEAIERMDVASADMELSRAATLFPAKTLVTQVIAPVLDQVGERWAHKELGVAQEHVASGLVRSLLNSLIRLYTPTRQSDTIVLSTIQGERHEFGLLLTALLAASRGWRVVYLGTDLPALEIAHALRLTNSRYLALSMVTTPTPEFEEELQAVARSIQPTTRVWIGGAEAPGYRKTIDNAGWVLIRDLDDLDDRLSR